METDREIRAREVIMYRDAPLIGILTDPPEEFCKSMIFNFNMHVLIMGAMLPLYFHLREDKDNKYFHIVSWTYAILAVIQLVLWKNWLKALAVGSFSHVLGVTVIFLLLRLLNSVVAMVVCIPLLLFLVLVFLFHLVDILVESVMQDIEEARRREHNIA